MPGDAENDVEFVSQDEIDRLLSQEDDAPGDDDVSGEATQAEDETQPPAAEMPSDAESTDDHGADEPSETGDAENDVEFVSQDEIDRLLSQEDDVSGDDDVSGESTQAGDKTEPSAEEMPSDAESADDFSSGEPPDPESTKNDDLDQLPEAETDIDETSVDVPVDRVILEEVPKATPARAPRGKHIWPLHKDFWITLSVVCLLGVGLNVLFWVHKKRSQIVIRPEVLSFAVVDTAALTAPVTFRDNPRALTLKGFLVPAPLNRKDLTYITADVSIELTHSKAVSLIKAHAPFYRNIIYEVIKRILSSLDKSKINEIGLKIEILKALNGSVPERSVRDVSVDTFVMF